MTAVTKLLQIVICKDPKDRAEESSVNWMGIHPSGISQSDSECFFFCSHECPMPWGKPIKGTRSEQEQPPYSAIKNAQPATEQLQQKIADRGYPTGIKEITPVSRRAKLQPLNLWITPARKTTIPTFPMAGTVRISVSYLCCVPVRKEISFIQYIEWTT
ncbi:hypothetical protein NPIL_297611 [Nephila pilipes]|uniref:Uncharacterized protein n=1 Tax=Nephila pilipes TaxID=299642 RepID=A0A8X6QM62_NEPPI|nr:hypothetical protein NPIL_297611 [Nephila pilipes]